MVLESTEEIDISTQGIRSTSILYFFLLILTIICVVLSMINDSGWLDQILRGEIYAFIKQLVALPMGALSVTQDEDTETTWSTWHWSWHSLWAVAWSSYYAD